MRSYILIPALAVLGWRATVVAAVASTEIPDDVDSLFSSANSSAPSDNLFEGDILPRQLYRAEDWASNPHGNPSFPYSHGAGKRSLEWNEAAKRTEGGDWLQRHGLMPAESPRGTCTRGQGTRDGGMKGVAGGGKAHGVCSRQGGKPGKGSNGSSAVEGDPRPAQIQGDKTHVVQSGKEGSIEGGEAKKVPRPAKVKGGKTQVTSTKPGKTGESAGVKGNPGPAKVQGGEKHAASTKGAKTGGETKGAGIKWGPGPVKIQGSDGDKTGAGMKSAGGSQATGSREGGVSVKGSKTGEGEGSESAEASGGGAKGKCDKGGKSKPKPTSEKTDKVQRGACSKEGSQAQKGGAKEHRRAAT